MGVCELVFVLALAYELIQNPSSPNKLSLKADKQLSFSIAYFWDSIKVSLLKVFIFSLKIVFQKENPEKPI